MDEVKRLKTKILKLVEKRGGETDGAAKFKNEIEIQQSKAEKLQILFLRTKYESEKTFETNKYEEKKNLAMEKKCKDFEKNAIERKTREQKAKHVLLKGTWIIKR